MRSMNRREFVKLSGITFEPGSYSDWHTHDAMTVIGVAGLGIIVGTQYDLPDEEHPVGQGTVWFAGKRAAASR